MLKFNKEWIQQLKKSTGITVSPIHDFALLKEIRLELFEEETRKYLEFYDTSTREEHYKEWLNKEIEVVNKWLNNSENDLNTNVQLNKYEKWLKAELSKELPPQPIVESPFSVLEWATIFYYADETKLLTESRLIKTRLEQFMSKHQINTTFDNFKTKYYEAKKRINEKNDYPINKLELIIPFLKENYKQTVTRVENEIIFLKENKPEY